MSKLKVKENDQYLHYEVGKQLGRLFIIFLTCVCIIQYFGIMYNVCNTCTCKSHLQSGEKQIGYDFGISNMSKTSFLRG
jgi:hypothetical protein